MKKNHIYQGDAIDLLKTFPDESIDMCITSPPYWALRDYGTATWEGGDEDCDHKMKTDAGKGSLQEKSGGASGHVHRDCKCGAKRIDKQLGLEPTFQEYINKLCDIFDEVKRVLKKEGTCWVNLGDTYAGSGQGTWKNPPEDIESKEVYQMPYNSKPRGSSVPDKCLIQIPSRFAIEMTNRGWILRNELIWYKPSCMPSSVKDRFTVDFEKIFFFTKNKKYYFEQQLEKSIHTWNSVKGFSGGGKRGTLHEYDKRQFNGEGTHENVEKQGRNKRCVWKINTKPFADAHFAVYPPELIETPIKAGCPKGGVVLDVFMGSGTTGLVARHFNKSYIGIELNPDYIKIADKRLAQKPLL